MMVCGRFSWMYEAISLSTVSSAKRRFVSIVLLLVTVSFSLGYYVRPTNHVSQPNTSLWDREITAPLIIHDCCCVYHSVCRVRNELLHIRYEPCQTLHYLYLILILVAAIDRVNRIGQKKSVHVYQLIAVYYTTRLISISKSIPVG